jgi:hypothetical protein
MFYLLGSVLPEFDQNQTIYKLNVLPPWISSAWIWSTPNDLHLSNFLIAISSCMYLSLLTQLSIQYIVGICKQITILNLHQVTSRLETILEPIYVPLQVSNISVLTMSFKLINFVFPILPSFVPESSTSYTCYNVRTSLLIWPWFCSHSNFTCFLWINNSEHFSPNHGLC